MRGAPNALSSSHFADSLAFCYHSQLPVKKGSWGHPGNAGITNAGITMIDAETTRLALS
ncbi:hypothetical protein Pla52o_27010 [Novipirellula galeiformis]|uniref:Uncharacterized protein n=1 Tax=Novipirellula galeiformis TaxID=2528004 RepID=A0A5C6CJ00_9BACT|nr:hypothetical protein Pla52o_27010 [Novipirellula galeiformis]